MSGAIDSSTIGPIVTGWTKCPSPTSKWKTRAPASQQRARSARRGARSPPRRATARSRPSGSSRAQRHGADPMARSRATKKPDVPWTCGSVSRNSGRRGWRNCGHSSPSRLDREAGRVDDRLVLVRVDRADRVDDRAARPHALGGRAQQRELELRQRLARASAGRAARASTPRPEHGASTSARSKPVELRRQRAPSASTTRTFVARRAARRSPRARARGLVSPRPRPPRRASIVALPPGAAQRSSDALARPASRRRGRRAASRGSAARSAPPRAPARRRARRGTRPGRPVGSPSARSPRTSRTTVSRRLVLRPHQRERLLRAEVAPPDVSPIQSGYECLSGPSGSALEQRARSRRRAAHDGVRERDGALEPRARGRARRTRSTAA